MLPAFKRKPQTGNILIAEPFLHDKSFKRSVIWLTNHDENGSRGFILNKQTNIKLNKLIDDFPMFDIPVFYGGPVETDSLFFIHTAGKLIEGAEHFLPGYYVGGNFDTLKFLIDTKQLKTYQVKFFIGYSGWVANQLESEMNELTWMVTDFKNELGINADNETLWSNYVKGMGKDYTLVANSPEYPSLN
ncbi:MAG: YqgE/AlgH family protein [Bacteroidia bacterium]|nr:YqgE/AlgH family protein [Bacteroidia bacterium]HQV01558.1 YqgE/AlgH family protein [Bacteroidia bacterium]